MSKLFAIYHSPTKTFYSGNPRPEPHTVGFFKLATWFINNISYSHGVRSKGDAFLFDFYSWINQENELAKFQYEENVRFLIGCAVVEIDENKNIIQTVELGMFVIPNLINKRKR